MKELFELMQSNEITITAPNGNRATLKLKGALIGLIVASNRRIPDELLRRAFGMPDDTPPGTLVDSGPVKRVRSSWPV